MDINNFSVAYINETAHETMSQIIAGVGNMVVLSWGFARPRAAVAEYQGRSCAALAFRVSGLLHRGIVVVLLDEMRDVYIVRLLDDTRTMVAERDCVYCDQLGTAIDEMVERGATMTDEEYRTKAMADSRAKMLADNDGDRPSY